MELSLNEIIQPETQHTNNGININVDTTQKDLSKQDLGSFALSVNETQMKITSLILKYIPREVWVKIFLFVSSNEDISSIFILKCVCKDWSTVLFEDSITFATITKPNSAHFLTSLPNLQSLIIETKCTIPNSYFMNNFTKLVNLKIFSSPLFYVNMTCEAGISRQQVSNIWNSMTNLKSLELDTKLQCLLFTILYSPTIPIMTLSDIALTSLHTLRIGHIGNGYPQNEDRDQILKFFEILKTLKNLKVLDIERMPDRGSNSFNLTEHDITEIQSFLETQLDQFECINFPYLHITRCSRIQKNYPNILFGWYCHLETSPNYYNKTSSERKGKIERLFRYEGNFSTFNLFHGNGKILDCYSDWGYVGEFKNGSYSGRGVLTISSLEIYEGEFKNGKMEGRGIFHSYGGDRYEGEYKDGKMEGRGIYYFSNGDRYEGDFKNGEMEGRGIFHSSGGDRYEGDFKDGKIEGIGIYYFSNGDRYEGEFKNGKMEGKGIRHFSNGDRYEGEYTNDMLEGMGIIFYSDGSRYEGQFNNNMKVDNKL